MVIRLKVNIYTFLKYIRIKDKLHPDIEQNIHVHHIKFVLRENPTHVNWLSSQDHLSLDRD